MHWAIDEKMSSPSSNIWWISIADNGPRDAICLQCNRQQAQLIVDSVNAVSAEHAYQFSNQDEQLEDEAVKLMDIAVNSIDASLAKPGRDEG